MLAVTSAMVVPSITLVGQGDLKEESSRLRLVLAYALDEAQLSGYPIRWVATKSGWSFEVYTEERKQKSTLNLDRKITWQALSEKPLETYDLPQGITITQVEQAGDFFADSLFLTEDTEKGEDKEPKVGVVLLLPDGTTSQSNVYLQNEEEIIAVVEVRPGPTGIRMKKAVEP